MMTNKARYGNPETSQWCRRGKQAMQAACETFGQEALACTAARSDFFKKCGTPNKLQKTVPTSRQTEKNDDCYHFCAADAAKGGWRSAFAILFVSAPGDNLPLLL